MNPAALWMSRHLTEEMLVSTLRLVLKNRSAALCLHRVLPKWRSTDVLTFCTHRTADLDRLLELLARVCPRRRWLTVSFDDGYADALSYIETRAARFSMFDWIAFINPAKMTTRAGFRWDWCEEATKSGQLEPACREFIEEPGRFDDELTRQDLAGLGDHPDYLLATVEQARRTARLPNVTLGNHGNRHLRLSRLTDDEVRREARESHEAFSALFGAPRHTALPFGTPKFEFFPRHLDFFREAGARVIWTTSPCPYEAHEAAGAAPLLPRFAPHPRLTPRETLAWLIERILVWRVRRRLGSFAG